LHLTVLCHLHLLLVQLLLLGLHGCLVIGHLLHHIRVLLFLLFHLFIHLHHLGRLLLLFHFDRLLSIWLGHFWLKLLLCG
jgi:hypothetical protein